MEAYGTLLEIIAAICTILSIHFYGIKRWPYYVHAPGFGCISAVLWFFIGVYHGMEGLIILNTFLLGVNIKNLWKARKSYLW